MVGAGYCNRVSLLSVVSAGSAAPTSTRRRGVRTYAWRVEEKFGGSESKIRVNLLPPWQWCRLFRMVHHRERQRGGRIRRSPATITMKSLGHESGCRRGFLDPDPDRFVRIDENTYRTIANGLQCYALRLRRT